MEYYPSQNIPTNPSELPSFLRDELQRLQQALAASQKSVPFVTLHVEPTLIKEGMIVLADGTDFNPGQGAGYYARLSDVWVKFAESTGSSGTVTSVSVVNANGVSGTVATATTTPAITVSLGNITPTSVAATGNVTGANLSGTNTGDQTIELTGDVTGSGTGSFETTLKTVNSNIGTFGSASQTPQFIVNEKGLITQVTNVAISGVVPGGSSGGDLSGTYPNPTVAKINNANLGTTTATLGNLLIGSGTSWETKSISGDVVINGLGVVTIEDGSVSYAKMQNVSSTNKLLGSSSTTTDIQEISIGTGLSISGSTLSASANGTVTSFSFTDANGISGIVTDSTTTPDLSLELGDITPTSVTASGSVAGSNLSGTNTGDQTIQLTGDVTGTGTGSFAATLSTVNSNVGSFGTATKVPAITVNAKGLITAASESTISISSSSVNDFSEAVDDRVAALIQNGTGLAWTYNDASGTLTGNVSITPFSTSDLAEGSNLYYTNARFNSSFSGKSTTDLSEGANLYFTNSRAIASPLTGYVSGAGTINSSDSILQAIQKLNGNVGTLITGVSSVFGRSGVVTAQSGDYTTSLVIESGNLYFTDERCQDAIGSMIDETLTYVDATPTLGRAEITGDVSIASGSNASTLATVNSNVGGFGSATQVGTFTVNAKGLVTAASNTSIQISESQVTGLVSDLSNKQPLDAALTSLSNLPNSANLIPYFSGVDTFSTRLLSSNAVNNSVVIRDGAGGFSAFEINILTGIFIPFNGISAYDQDGSNALNIRFAGNLTGNRSLSIFVNDSDRSLTIAGDTTVSGTNTGDQTIELTGDVTGTGPGTFATTIANNAVTLAKFQTISTDSFLGRDTAGTGNVEVLSVATSKTLLNLSGTNSGDVTLAGENYLSLSAQALTANAINLAGTNVTGILPNAKTTATSGNTNSTIVARDASGNFSGNKITADLGIVCASTSQNNFSNNFSFEKRGNNSSSSNAVASGAELGYQQFLGWDGSAYKRGAYIASYTKEVFTGTAHGASLNFVTTTPGTTTEVVRAVIDNAGLAITGAITATGTIRSTSAGQLLNIALNNTVSTPVTINSTTYTEIINFTYTPVSSSSYLIVTFNSVYYIGGINADDFYSQILVNSTEITYGYQAYASGSGGGTRSGTLFPLMGIYTNNSTSSVTIKVLAKRGTSDDTLVVLRNNSTHCKVEEIAR